MHDAPRACSSSQMGRDESSFIAALDTRERTPVKKKSYKKRPKTGGTPETTDEPAAVRICIVSACDTFFHFFPTGMSGWCSFDESLPLDCYLKQKKLYLISKNNEN
ncbi:hypothetical protein PUN28_007068 [Cardiocondyla obscurior]|uniref:Uncharacterized protein n=1 Tax=Cardiocondyla obscurior TaxID=286306 RepID=A0AAW2G156_9HYME